MDREIPKQSNFKEIKLPVRRKDHGKIEEQHKFSLTYLIMKIKLHTISILKNNLLKTMLIYY